MFRDVLGVSLGSVKLPGVCIISALGSRIVLLGAVPTVLCGKKQTESVYRQNHCYTVRNIEGIYDWPQVNASQSFQCFNCLK